MTQITSLTVPNSILAIADHAVAFSGIISDSNAITENGRKIIKAGTPVGGQNNFLQDENAVLNTANDSTAQGIVEYDVDVTEGTGNATVLVEAYINESKIPSISNDAKNKLTKITFLRR